MSKEERIENTRKKLWQEGDTNRKVNERVKITILLETQNIEFPINSY